MPSIQAARMIRALVRLGWTVAWTSGRHHVLTKSGHPRITVPVHRGKTLKEGLARGILKDAGITEEDFFDAH